MQADSGAARMTSDGSRSTVCLPSLRKAGLAPREGQAGLVSGGQVISNQETGLRCRMTYSSVPVPGPLLLPEGWPVW